MIPVWSNKIVLKMVFVESTSFIWPLYMALRLKPLTEQDCRVVSHDFKNVYNYAALKGILAGTLGHLTYAGMSIRDSKITPKVSSSIYLKTEKNWKGL